MRALPRLLLIALVVLAAVVIAGQPGTVAIVWQGWRIDTSVPVLIAATLVAALAAALTIGLLRRLIGSPRAILRARRERRRRAGYRALTQGMVAVAAGDPEEAQRQARRADVLLAEPPLTLLLSAQAAQLNGDEDAARKYFSAMLGRPETEFLGLRGLLTQALKRGDEETALRLAERAHLLHPKTPWVLTHLLELQTRAGQWGRAQATLGEAQKARLLPVAASRHHQAALLAAEARLAEAEGETKRAVQLAARAQDLAPDLAAASAGHALLLLRAGHPRRAAKAIEAAWRTAPHPALAAAYRDIGAGESAITRLKRLERLAALNPDHPESHLALAEAALAAQLWGEARRHLAAATPGIDAAEASPPPARFCRLMAALEEAEHGDEAAAKAWLARAASAPPDPCYVCAECAAETIEWQPLCPRCRAFDRLAWQSPAHARPALAPGAPPLALAPAAPPAAVPAVSPGLG